MPPKPGILDGLSRADNLLAENVQVLRDLKAILSRKEERETKVVYFTYPDDGSGLVTLQAGTTTLDFAIGRITDVDGAVTKMRHSLQSEARDWLRSFFIQSDKLMVIQPDTDDPIIATEGRDAVATQQQFKKLKLTTEVETKAFIAAFTSPEAAIQIAAAPLTVFDVRKELIQNGGFETGDLTHWVYTQTPEIPEIISTDKKYGTYCAKLHGGAIAGAQLIVDDLIDVRYKEVYRFSAWIKNSTTRNVRLFLTKYDSNKNSISDYETVVASIGTSWTHITCSYVVEDAVAFIRPIIYTGALTGEYSLIDSVTFQRITQQIDASGYLQVVLPNQEKAEDAAHTSGDKGIMSLVVRKDDVGTLCSADGDYTPLIVNEFGILRTQAQQHKHIEECEATTGWTVLGNDTINLATTVNHVFGQNALEFDKVNGAANTKIAGIQKTLTSMNLIPYHVGGGHLLMSIYLSSLTGIDYIFLRLGTDSSNYNEWQVDSDNLVEGWNLCACISAHPETVQGNGWNDVAVTYVAAGAAFDAETDTLADIAMDRIAYNTGLMSSVPVVEARNINLLKIKNKVVNVGAGDAGTGTQRTTIATDDVNLAAIKTAIEILDNFISGTKGLVTEDNSAAIKAAVEFSGAFYSKNFTAPNAASEAPIEAAAKKLKDVVINNTHATYEAELRKASGDWVEIKPGRSTGFTLIDLNTVYVKAQTDGENPVLDVWGVEP